jgi:hypothetical protein
MGGDIPGALGFLGLGNRGRKRKERGPPPALGRAGVGPSRRLVEAGRRPAAGPPRRRWVSRRHWTGRRKKWLGFSEGCSRKEYIYHRNARRTVGSRSQPSDGCGWPRPPAAAGPLSGPGGRRARAALAARPSVFGPRAQVG